MTTTLVAGVRGQKPFAAIAVTALLSCAFLLPATAARAAAADTAQAPQTFGIKPSHATLRAPIDARSRFDYSATPGAVQPDFVAITNDAETSATLSLYASDGFNTDSDGFDLLVASKKPVDVGSWITLKSTHLVVPGRRTVVVPFTLRVPAKIAPGDHVGGIVASLRTIELDKKGNKVAVDHRVGVRVYARIQGPLDARLAVTGLTAKYHGTWWNPFAKGNVTVSYVVRNPGNVRLGAHQSVKVTGSFGGAAAAAVSDVAELLPDNQHAESIVVNGVRPAFRERVLVNVEPFPLPGDIDGRLTTVTASTSFWAVSLPLLGILILLIALAGFGLFRLARRRGPKTGPPVSGTPRTSVGAKP